MVRWFDQYLQTVRANRGPSCSFQETHRITRRIGIMNGGGAYNCAPVPVRGGGRASRLKEPSSVLHATKRHKAGLVGPAFFAWNWFGRSCFDRLIQNVKFQLSVDRKMALGTHHHSLATGPISSLISLCAAQSPTRVATYITIARFSSSCCRTGKAQPAISTRPAASRAALGETP
jgi:hypothetical protein